MLKSNENRNPCAVSCAKVGKNANYTHRNARMQKYRHLSTSVGIGINCTHIGAHMSDYTLHHGDCIEIMQGMPENSVDSIVCDPPYLLEFMGKAFDKQHKTFPGDNDGQKMQAWHERWARGAMRVLKPGGHLLAFGGTRTSHRLTSALEDAGFEIRDTVEWIYGSG